MYQFRNKDLIINLNDSRLFDELFRQYSKPLFYYASKFVDETVAKDIIQDVFVKLWCEQTITISHSTQSLLFAMVRNGCLHHLEKQKVRNKYLELNKLTLHEEELRYYLSGNTSLIEQELEAKLNEVLSSLPERCHQVFLMSRFESKKNKEIAEELGISLKAVEKQITKALAIIRLELKDYLPLVMIFFSSQLFN
jgi:RNA polymerase sigma-70 factor, ECF subfamily